MKEILRLYEVEAIEQDRLDAIYLEDDRLSFRSKNTGQIVMNTYDSYYCEAVYQLDKENTEKFVASLNSSLENLAKDIADQFVSPAGLDRLKRYCDQNNIVYQYEFIVD